MIDGVKILSEYTLCFPWYGVLGLSLAIALLFFLAFFAIVDRKNKIMIKILIASSVLVFSITSIILLIFSHKDSKILYKVTIDDSVSFNDVIDLYNIEDIDGDIISITIKDNE